MTNATTNSVQATTATFTDNQGVRLEVLQSFNDRAISLADRSDLNKGNVTSLAEERTDLVISYLYNHDSIEEGLTTLCGDLQLSLKIVGIDLADKKQIKRAKETCMRSFVRAVENATEKSHTLKSNRYSPTWLEKVAKPTKTELEKLEDTISCLPASNREAITIQWFEGHKTNEAIISEHVEAARNRKLSTLTQRATAVLEGKGLTITESRLTDMIDTLQIMEG